VNVVAASLGAAGGLAVAGTVLAILSGRSFRAALVGALTALSGAAAVVAGAAAAGGTAWSLVVPDLLPLTGVELATDPLSGWFLLLIGAVTAVCGIYAIGYASRQGHGPGSRTSLALLPLFAASLMLVPVAASVPTLLVGWELMAVTSLLLVLTEHRHAPAVRDAGIWYAALTQLGFVALLVGLTWLASAAGGTSFADIRAGAATVDSVTAGLVFLLGLVGFAGKAGAVPLHPWLPRAHAESCTACCGWGSTCWAAGPGGGGSSWRRSAPRRPCTASPRPPWPATSSGCSPSPRARTWA